MRLAVAGVKGAPGTTTAGFGLAAAAAASGVGGLLVEADPDGGAAAIRLGLGRDPGLASLAAAGRHGLSADLIASHGQALAEGLGVLIAPSAPHQARACLDQLGAGLEAALRDLSGRWAGSVVIDVGRTGPGVLGGMDLDAVIWVVPPTLEGADSAAGRVRRDETDPARSLLLAVGEGPYAPEEVAAHLGLRLLGAIGWNPPAAARLWSTRGDASALRSPLGRAWSATFASLRKEMESAVASPGGDDTGPVSLGSVLAS